MIKLKNKKNSTTLVKKIKILIKNYQIIERRANQFNLI